MINRNLNRGVISAVMSPFLSQWPEVDFTSIDLFFFFFFFLNLFIMFLRVKIAEKNLYKSLILTAAAVASTLLCLPVSFLLQICSKP